MSSRQSRTHAEQLTLPPEFDFLRRVRPMRAEELASLTPLCRRYRKWLRSHAPTETPSEILNELDLWVRQQHPPLALPPETPIFPPELTEARRQEVVAEFCQTTRIPPAADGVKIVFHHGHRSYSVAGQLPIVVSVEEHNALAAFLLANAALDTFALEDKGCSNVVRIMGQLDKKFPGTVRRPRKGRKGEGYYIRVEPAPQK